MIAIEQGNRRAEIDGSIVSFFRLSGDKRRSKTPVWWVIADNAETVATDWALHRRLPR